MPSSTKAPPDLAWVYVSGAAFLCALLAAGLFIAFADRLAFISNAVYYVLLMPIALASAAFLFGAMRSHARYKGSSPKGTLQLGGPVVVFAMVLLGGLMLANPASTSTLTVRLYAAEGKQPLTVPGQVVLDLGDDRRTQTIGPDGQVIFAQVPVQFLSSEVNVIPRVDRHRVIRPGPYRVSAARVIEIEMERLPDSTTVAGSVLDARGPIPGALINFDHGLITTRTDENGNFRVVVPMEEGRVIPVTVTLGGQTVYDDNYVVAREPGLRISIPAQNR